MTELSTNRVPIHTSEFISKLLGQSCKREKILQKFHGLCTIKKQIEVGESIIPSEIMDSFWEPRQGNHLETIFKISQLLISFDIFQYCMKEHCNENYAQLKLGYFFSGNLAILVCYFQVGHPPLCVTFSVHPSVAHHFSGTVHHIIIIFGTQM